MRMQPGGAMFGGGGGMNSMSRPNTRRAFGDVPARGAPTPSMHAWRGGGMSGGSGGLGAGAAPPRWAKPGTTNTPHVRGGGIAI